MTANEKIRNYKHLRKVYIQDTDRKISTSPRDYRDASQGRRSTIRPNQALGGCRDRGNTSRGEHRPREEITTRDRERREQTSRREHRRNK